MADPIVGIVNGVPTSGTGNITTLGQTLVDGANATHGALADAAVAAGAAGSFSAKLRAISRDIGSLVTGTVLAAGSALIGIVKIGDGTNTATVKAASTAALATDTALVVAISPNSAGSVAQGSATSGQTGALIQGAVTTAAPAYTTAQTSPLSLDAAGNLRVIPLAVTATANGATASRINAAATTNATLLKASAGQLYTLDFFNVAAYSVFLKLYNKASAPTVGTDTPVMTIPIQAGGGYSKTWPMGLPFSTGIAYAITKLQADSDTTVVVAGDLTGNTTWI
jgi:hypothetical protein